ncbi:MAG: hypothetical protein E5X85_34820 [Mesorhizobium sp.]|nr:MAG: hypothetical protein E5Y09_33885 [Mesorhizobium sp.]TIO64046.1 MAG: hypothetical protein E5X85_34820 [Mesorhizobium sp.]TJV88181.1 MAG: hypothetical protein E5X84_27770 [Mesorhizobium sp.]
MALRTGARTARARGILASRPDANATPGDTGQFEAEPWRTGSELLSRLQAECPGDYPDRLLRTLRRRLKVWRSEQADA